VNPLKYALTVLILLCAICNFSRGAGVILYEDVAEYWAYSGQTVTFQWKLTGGSFFHAKTIHVENSAEDFVASTTEVRAVYVIPRAGHYDFYVRTCDWILFLNATLTVDPPTGNDCYCTDWAVSTDPDDEIILENNGNYAFGAWRVNATLAPPGSPTLD